MISQELKRYALDFARPLFTDVINSDGFAALNKDLTTQLMRELVAKRRLVVASSSSCESSDDDSESRYERRRVRSRSDFRRSNSPHSSDSDSSGSHSDAE